MGGCASKPKEFNRKEQTAPAPVEQPAKAEETVATPVAAETTTSTADDKQESSDVSKEKSIGDEVPLVDLLKSDEGENKETIAAETVPVLILPGEAIVVENPKGETVEVEVSAKEGEIIYVEAVKETKEAIKETKEAIKETKEAVKETKEAVMETKGEEEKKEEEKPKTAPVATSEDKKEEPVVKV